LAAAPTAEFRVSGNQVISRRFPRKPRRIIFEIKSSRDFDENSPPFFRSRPLQFPHVAQKRRFAGIRIFRRY